MCLCSLSPILKDLRRAINDSEEDTIVPRVPREIYKFDFFIVRK